MADGFVFGDLAVADLKDVDVRHRNTFARRWEAEQHAPEDGSRWSSLVRAREQGMAHDEVALGDELLDGEVPVWKDSEQLGECALEALLAFTRGAGSGMVDGV